MTFVLLKQAFSIYPHTRRRSKLKGAARGGSRGASKCLDKESPHTTCIRAFSLVDRGSSTFYRCSFPMRFATNFLRDDKNRSRPLESPVEPGFGKYCARSP